ncbi:BQ5605_C023g09708 [Microbotryum silenes-dioicae]|uniref:BQ5605_C023g09708 protein n=1 Tax=Microbotryum silenes-dioicae TaxID=796604 RepID=A0A2X0PLR1_9BASI|nr:BQ5605_C023g09708 [Microbotryum silenes-dioicae]
MGLSWRRLADTRREPERVVRSCNSCLLCNALHATTCSWHSHSGTWNRTGSVAAATSSPPASTSSQGSGIGSSRHTPDSATPSRADKRRINELSIDGQDSAPSAVNQLGKKPLGRPPNPQPASAPAAKRAQGRPRKTDEEKEKTAKPQAKQAEAIAEEKAAKKRQDEEQAR